MPQRDWLPNPEPGTKVCGGFDGSYNDDWTGIKLETREGFVFTPRWPGTDEPMIWNPKKHDGTIPRARVHDAWSVLAERYELLRVYCDPGVSDPLEPTSWLTEIETWATLYGERVFVPWTMSGSFRLKAVHAALVRFEADLRTRAVTHDGCPWTTTHAGNARKIPKPGDRFILGKPAQSQKIDLIVASVLAHEAGCDMRAEGWPERVDSTLLCFR